MTYFNQLEQFTDYRVSITHPEAGIKLGGLINNETLSYQTQANLGISLAAQMVKNATEGALTSMSNKGGVMGALATAGEMSGITSQENLQKIAFSKKRFNSSDPTSLSITLHLFPNKFGNLDYPDIELQLSKMTQPDFDNLGQSYKSYLYEKFTTEELNPVNDTLFDKLIQVEIGKWFRTQRCLRLHTRSLRNGIIFAFRLKIFNK
jgi:hypothetical protein